MEDESVSVTFDNRVADHLAAERLYYRSNSLAKLDKNYHLTFDRAGIQFRTRSIDSRLAWNHYTQVLEDDRLWLLVYGTQMYTVVPKRAFTGQGDMARFRSLVGDCIAARTSGTHRESRPEA